VPHIGGEDCQTAVILDPLEPVIHLDVRVAVVAVLHLATVPEQRVRFLEEEDRPAPFGSVERLAQVRFTFADVLADNADKGMR
jgi:hypothetical protein